MDQIWAEAYEVLWAQSYPVFLNKEAESLEADYIGPVNTSENFSLTENNSSKEKHIALVEKAIKQIENSDLKKIVVSRKEQLQLNELDIITIYQKLLEKIQHNNIFCKNKDTLVNLFDLIEIIHNPVFLILFPILSFMS